MKIQNLFEREITRPINGVVKADQLDNDSVWQELDEFVVTRELDQHLRQFFSANCEALQQPKNPDVTGKIGVGYQASLAPENHISSKCCRIFYTTTRILMRTRASPHFLGG